MAVNINTVYQKVLAIANSVIVAMDLKNRKSVQIPYKMKTSLENIVLNIKLIYLKKKIQSI